MTLKSRLRAAIMPSAFLPSLGAIAAGVLLMTLQTTSAQAAGQFYNCANATGCNTFLCEQYNFIFQHSIDKFICSFRIYSDHFNYLPIQNLAKMLPNISSLLICPVISPR